jgi:hypothetical protein
MSDYKRGSVKVVIVAVLDDAFLMDVESKVAAFKESLRPYRFRAEVRIMEGLPDPEKAYEP